MLRGWRRLFAALIAVALCSSMATAPATAGGKGGGGGKKPSGGTTVGTPNGNFSCRAALARLEGAGLLEGVDKELFVANAPGNPCVTDFAGILASLNVSASLHHQKMTTTDLLSADVKVLYGQTQLLKDAGYSVPRRGVAEAGVALIRVSVLGVQIEVAVLTAEAAAHCAAGDVAALKGRSKVVGLKIDGVHKDGADGIDISLGRHLDIHLSVGLLASLEVKASFGHLFTEVELDAMLATGLTLHLNHQDVVTGPGSSQLTQRALWLETDLIGDVIISEAIADFHGDPCTTTTGPPPPPPPPSAAKGWMTGGGRINPAGGGKVTHGFRLECTPANGQNNLQVNWAGGGFHLESVNARKTSCHDAPGIDAGNPEAAFDTLVGEGSGRCNGGTAHARYTLTDAGEPGTADTFTIEISGSCTLSASGTLERGNHQAHGRP